VLREYWSLLQETESFDTLPSRGATSRLVLASSDTTTVGDGDELSSIDGNENIDSACIALVGLVLCKII
jgi:hypothetical protein